MSAQPAPPRLDVAPGSVVVVRDEEWMVTQVSQTRDGQLLTVQGLSELVRDTSAQFYSGFDDIQVSDPRQTRVTADTSPGYRMARLWVEAALRKTPLPMDDDTLAVTPDILADSLDYQRSAVQKVFDPNTFRPRILLADTVGLGKTLEIGMILAELIRRGRGERILIVTPRHVLEQMQHEMWTRFAIPFVRLDSVGIQRVRRELPATRNPFSRYKRAIISIDTLKNDRYLAHLRKHRWDAVVIDESHNVTNTGTQNNRLADTLAPQTEALILASATPHNGRKESFAELIRLLEPTAVTPDGDVSRDELARLVVRRHRHSPEVAQVVGAEWAERRPPDNRLVPASAQENAIADLLVHDWLYPVGQRSKRDRLFAWTLAKAYLSSPAALAETARNRLRTGREDETDSLHALIALAEQAGEADSGKYGALLKKLKEIGISNRAPQRVVIFAERIATLNWLRQRLTKDLKLKASRLEVLHGSLSDEKQQEIVESFKQESSPIRVLVTGDVASEGVNLHLQCHELVHFDIPWSLIRIEQRNGRIDRYGQRHRPQITTLLLQPDHERFAGDLRVLVRLMEKEHEAHTALGDTASLMGEYDVKAEEHEILQVLAGNKRFEDVVAEPEQVLAGDGLAALLARLDSLPATPAAKPSADHRHGLYAEPVDYLREALHSIYARPADPPSAHGGGVGWKEHQGYHLVELTPPADLVARLDVLPQTYLAQRRVKERMKLATTKQVGQQLLAEALKDDAGSSWPEAHYLGPLHPVLDWVSDRVLAKLGRREVFAVRGNVDAPTVLVQGTLTNRGGQTVAVSWVEVTCVSATLALATPHASAAELFAAVGFDQSSTNPGPIPATDRLTALMPAAIDAAEQSLAETFEAARQAVEQRVTAWVHSAEQWQDAAAGQRQIEGLRHRRTTVAEEQRLAGERRPAQHHLRPLLVVVPADFGTQEGER